MNILTRKNLKALNVPDEAIDAIVEAHSDAINDIKAERDKYAEQAKQIAALTTERDTLKQQLAEAKKSGGDAQKIQEAFDAYKQQVETEKKTATLTTAARKLLTSKGMQEKLADLVMAKRGLDGIISIHAPRTGSDYRRGLVGTDPGRNGQHREHRA